MNRERFLAYKYWFAIGFFIAVGVWFFWIIPRIRPLSGSMVGARSGPSDERIAPRKGGGL